MKIVDSTIGMQSQHELKQSIRISETRTVVGWRLSDIPAATPPSSSVSVSISDQAQQALQEKQASQVNPTEEPLQKFIPQGVYLKKIIVEKMLQTLTGKEIHIRLYPGDEETGDGQVDSKTAQIKTANFFSFQPGAQGFNLTPLETVERRTTISEQEALSFKAAGSVQTADGRVIDFSVGLEMRRELYMDFTSRRADRAVDPLTFNFNHQGVSLSEKKYQFDLDSDGVRENISFAGPGSGFLALDLNRDGKINDGRELFGPSSGNGFGELSLYDRDHNGWIDENDPIFNQLQIWEKDHEGRDHLFSLKDKGVGAIYLGSVKAEFALKSKGQTNGKAREAGVFLAEDGTAGTLQQIDLVV